MQLKAPCLLLLLLLLSIDSNHCEPESSILLQKQQQKMRHLRFIAPHLSRAHKTPFQIPNFKFPNLPCRQFTSAPQPEQSAPPPPSPPPSPSEKVSAIVDEISGLTLLEVSDLTELLRSKLGIKEMPVMAVMMPGMGFSGMAGMGGGGAAAGGKVEEKVEKTVFDVKLEGFDAASKIKVIKEVRAFTDLGLKEAKDLVEKAPSLVKKGVTKEEAEKFIEKMKGVGAKVLME